MLYFLAILFVLGLFLNFVGVLPYPVSEILWTGFYLLFACTLINIVFARLYKLRINYESTYITALILALVFGPVHVFRGLLPLTFLALVAVSSKYVITYKKKHIFNPAVFALFLSGMILNESASWWIESTYTIPIIILGGSLSAYRANRYKQLVGFLAAYFVVGLFLGLIDITSIFHPSIWFFAFVMLIEPLTSPVDRKLHIWFGVLIAVLYFLLREIAPGFAYRIEAALLTGNLVFFLVSNRSFMVRKKQPARGL
jgi:Na+-transporting NADH:ubiquinone oxidoreductase subunit NqrB